MTLVSWREVEHLLGANRRGLKNLAEKAGRFYAPFDVKKKSGGGLRHIDNPQTLLKEMQRKIYRSLLRDHEVPHNMVGGVARRSVRQNALAHVGHDTLVKLDLRNHFGRITNAQVFAACRRELGMSTEIARVITQLTTIQSRLPQGAPTSSMLANLVMLPAHREISLLAEQHGLAYTLFVDDLTISGAQPRAIIQQVIRVLQRYGFAVASKKLQIFDRNERQETTGLVVNHGVALPRDERQQIRLDVLRFSSAKTMSMQQYASLWGRIKYAGFINPAHGRVLSEFAEAKLPTPTDVPHIGDNEVRIPCIHSSRHRYRPGVEPRARPGVAA